MNIVFTVVFAFAIGFFVQQRGLAIVTYLALDAMVVAYQGVSVLLNWMADEPPVAFGPSPSGAFPIEYSTSETWGYGVINLAITTVGVGLVVLGTRVRARRAAGREVAAVG